MDLSHSGWSDIFFLGMDFPEGARVLNISIDLAVRRGEQAATPQPPVEAWFRIIDRPVLRLVSVDLEASTELIGVDEVFDFGRDYLGLLKGAVIAAGIVPAGMEASAQPLSEVLANLTGAPGLGIELVSKVNDIPKGSRLAVSTSLLASLIAVLMRATGQTDCLTGTLSESERRLVAARAILGEWLGGSGGGWQDSGGVWPGIKLIQGECARDGDPEFAISRGRLLPSHHVFTETEIPPSVRQRLQDSLVLVHGGMAQDVGPILEMVTEKYLLRSDAEWHARTEAMRILDSILQRLRAGDIQGIAQTTQRNFDGPIQTIVPWAANFYTDTLIREAAARFGERFWGFWMLGGMSGGGMGFIFDPEVRQTAQTALAGIMTDTKRRLERAVPFAMDPVVYDFAINSRGTEATLDATDAALMPAAYYTLMVPPLLRADPRSLSPMERREVEQFGTSCRQQPDLIRSLFERMVPRVAAESTSARTLDEFLKEFGFNRIQHEEIRADLRNGRIGLAKNRLPVNFSIEDATPADVLDARELPESLRQIGMEALAGGAIAVVTLAGGIGTRWTKGAGVVKALNPFVKMRGRHRSFLEVHLAKSRRTCRLTGKPLPHVVTTSYLTHDAVAAALGAEHNFRYEGPLHVSPGRFVGLRLVPMFRDLHFAWEETSEQLLDERAQKMRQSVRAALIRWAQQMGEGSDYTDNVPTQCLHPVGHWYEIPNLMLNGVLSRLLDDNPRLEHLFVHNIDTLGASVDPVLFARHIESGAAITTEVIARRMEDLGGGLARVNGQPRLVEAMALPREEFELSLSYYNAATMWIHIDSILKAFGLTRADLTDSEKTAARIRITAARMPTYITLKDVKKRWGKGQEDVYPVTQFEKLWGDMTALPELDCRYIAVPRFRGQQLKQPAQLDGWLREGAAAYTESLCDWPE
jgi:galactokinase/mevalonate kinase-like predicted kinase